MTIKNLILNTIYYRWGITKTIKALSYGLAGGTIIALFSLDLIPDDPMSLEQEIIHFEKGDE